MGYKKKVDKNQSQIVRELNRFGFGVIDFSRVGAGVPDICISHPESDANLLVEIKNLDGKSEETKFNMLTPAQVDFIACWFGEVYIGTSAENIMMYFSDYTGIPIEVIASYEDTENG